MVYTVSRLSIERHREPSHTNQIAFSNVFFQLSKRTAEMWVRARISVTYLACITYASCSNAVELTKVERQIVDIRMGNYAGREVSPYNPITQRILFQEMGMIDEASSGRISEAVMQGRAAMYRQRLDDRKSALTNDLRDLSNALITWHEKLERDHNLVPSLGIKIPDQKDGVAVIQVKSWQREVTLPQVPDSIRTIINGAAQAQITDALRVQLSETSRAYEKTLQELGAAALLQLKSGAQDEYLAILTSYDALRGDVEAQKEYLASLTTDSGSAIKKALDDFDGRLRKVSGEAKVDQERLRQEFQRQLGNSINLARKAADIEAEALTSRVNRVKTELDMQAGHWEARRAHLEEMATNLQGDADRMREGMKQVRGAIETIWKADTKQLTREAEAWVRNTGAQIKGLALDSTFIQQEVMARLPDSVKKDAVYRTVLGDKRAEADKIVSNFSTALNANTAAEGIAAGSAGLQGIGMLAHSLGVIDEGQFQSVQNAVGITNAALGLAGGVATGNPIAVINGVGALFGGGGGLGGGDDDEAAKTRHNQIMRELGAVRQQLEELNSKVDKLLINVDLMIDLQQQTLVKLDQIEQVQYETRKDIARLSEQVESLRQEVLAAISDVRLDVLALQNLINMTNQDVVNARRNCQEFVVRGANAKWIDNVINLPNAVKINSRLLPDGRYQSYEARAYHLKVDWEKFRACRQGLSGVNWFNSVGDDKPGPQFDLFRLVSVETSVGLNNTEFKKAYAYQKELWSPMLALHARALTVNASSGADLEMDECQASVLTGLAMMPRTLESLNARDLTCRSDATGARLYPSGVLASELFRPYKNFSEQKVRDAWSALDQVLHVGMLEKTADWMAFFGSFDELIREDAGKIRLATPREIAKRPDMVVKAPEWHGKMADALNVAAAQQTMFAGVAIADWAAKLLLENKFGAEPPDSNWPYTKADMEALLPGGSLPPDWRTNVGYQQQRNTHLFGTDAGSGWARRTGIKGRFADSTDPRMRICQFEPNIAAMPSSYDYAYVVCLMKRNPVFRDNVVNAALQNMFPLGAPRSGDFDQSYARPPSNSTWDMTLPGWDIKWRQAGASPFALRDGWYVQMRDEAGDLFEAPLPAPFYVTHKIAAYGPEADRVRDLRELNAKRLAFFNPTAISNSPEQLRLLQEAAIRSDNPLGLALYDEKRGARMFGTPARSPGIANRNTQHTYRSVPPRRNTASRPRNVQ